jgi:hypothetical protein
VVKYIITTTFFNLSQGLGASMDDIAIALAQDFACIYRKGDLVQGEAGFSEISPHPDLTTASHTMMFTDQMAPRIRP